MEQKKNYSKRLENECYILLDTNFFREQILKLAKDTRHLIEEKIKLVRLNPYRNKRLKGYKSLFRIRISDRRKKKRIIYTVKQDQIIFLCIIDRDKDYKDLEKYLKKFGIA